MTITLNKHNPPPSRSWREWAKGHPDTLADGISETISRSLSSSSRSSQRVEEGAPELGSLIGRGSQ
ncbi:MAG: hypothetical protein NTX42_08435 [Methanothrix sp.]|nr:hypothetical protein [Methanothrix sp.]